MESQADGVPPQRLEGLVLRDGDGAYYEVPRVVIERYRIADPQAAPRAAWPRADGAGYEPGFAPGRSWEVAGGVYAPSAEGEST